MPLTNLIIRTYVSKMLIIAWVTADPDGGGGPQIVRPPDNLV